MREHVKVVWVVRTAWWSVRRTVTTSIIPRVRPTVPGIARVARTAVAAMAPWPAGRIIIVAVIFFINSFRSSPVNSYRSRGVLAKRDIIRRSRPT